MKRVRTDIENARMLTLEQACVITGMGRNRCKEWCNRIGARRQFSPRMVRYDKQTIIRVLDEMAQAAVTETA